MGVVTLLEGFLVVVRPFSWEIEYNAWWHFFQELARVENNASNAIQQKVTTSIDCSRRTVVLTNYDYFMDVHFKVKFFKKIEKVKKKAF